MEIVGQWFEPWSGQVVLFCFVHIFTNFRTFLERYRRKLFCMLHFLQLFSAVYDCDFFLLLISLVSLHTKKHILFLVLPILSLFSLWTDLRWLQLLTYWFSIGVEYPLLFIYEWLDGSVGMAYSFFPITFLFIILFLVLFVFYHLFLEQPWYKHYGQSVCSLTHFSFFILFFFFSSCYSHHSAIHFKEPQNFAHHNFSDLTSFLQDLATRYPAITKLYSIGQSVEKRDLWVLEISDNPGIHEPGDKRINKPTCKGCYILVV